MPATVFSHNPCNLKMFFLDIIANNSNFDTIMLLPLCCYHCFYHYVATIMFLPLCCYHYVATIMLLPLCCYHYVATIMLLPLCCYHYVATIMLLPLCCYHYVNQLHKMNISFFKHHVLRNVRAFLVFI